MSLPTSSPLVNGCTIDDGEFYRELLRIVNNMVSYYHYLSQTQEWHWNDGDVSINIIVDRSLEGDVFIYINELLVGRFAAASFRGHTRLLYSGHDSNYLNCDVLTAMLELIEKWKIGV